MFESRTYYYREPNHAIQHNMRSERLQRMIDECLGGQRPKKLISELRRELAEQQVTENQEYNERKIRSLESELATCKDKLKEEKQERADLYQQWLDCKTPRPVFGDAACFWVGLIGAAVITSFVWAVVMFG